MFSQDYILRIISQATAALATVLGLKKAGKYDEAQQAIDQALEQLLGLDSFIIKQLEDRSLLEMLTKEQRVDSARLGLVADLFKEEGDILAEQKRLAESRLSYQRALVYTLETGFDEGEPSTAELTGKIEGLIDSLKGGSIPGSTLWTLFCYYERAGLYKKAADTLDEMAAHPEAGSDVQPERSAFYERLGQKSASELAAGGLDRAEVQHRLESLKPGA